MATITGLTKERMIEIENASIVDGEVVGDNLILTRFDETTINAGSVRGPVGTPGVSEATFNARLAEECPVGRIMEYIGEEPPDDTWLTMMGQEVVNAQTLYPAFWAIVPAAMKSGTSVIMPDTMRRVSVGLDPLDAGFDTPGTTGGEETVALTAAQIPVKAHDHGVSDPQHAHVMDHDHPSFVANYVTPDYSASGPMAQAGSSWEVPAVAGGGLVIDVPYYSGNTSVASTGIDILPTVDGSPGTAHNNMQPYVVFLKIIKVS